MLKFHFSIYLSAILFLFCLVSCSIEKRTYQSGFYIQNLQHKSNSSNALQSTSPESFKFVNEIGNSDFRVLSFRNDSDSYLAVSDSVQPCSIIYTRDARELRVIITDINSSKISYKMCDNPLGPIYSVSATQVLTVKFHNEDAGNYDLILMRNGQLVKSNVSEIDDVKIKYKRFDNLTGPNYSMEKSQVLFIKYKNGSKDLFQTTSADELNINNPQNKPVDEKVNLPKSEAKGFGIVSLIFGLLGFYVAFAIPFGLIAIIFGSIGMNKKLKGLAIAGFVLGLISLLFGIFLFI